MTIASTAFMSSPGGYSTTLATKLDKIDMSQALSAVLKGDRQLLGHIRMGVPAHNVEVNWIEDGLNAAYVMGSSSGANTVVTLTAPTVAASIQRLLRNGSLLQPNGTDIIVQLSATVSKNTLAVIPYGSTVWASWTNTKCWIVGNPYTDLDAASNDISLVRTKRKNFTQIFERAIEITQTRKNMDMEAVVNELQLQTKRRTMEIKRELDMSVIRGYAYISASNTTGGDLERRTMAGLIQLIKDPDQDTTDQTDTIITAGAALTVGYINSLCYKIWEQGGLDETADPIIVVGPKQARNIAAFEKELRRVEQGERQVGYYRNIFMSDMGVELPIVMDRWFPDDKLMILDRSRVSLRPLQGDSWHLEKMAKTGRTEKWQLSGQYTIECRNGAEAHGIIQTLT
jgi:hypothetical protein